jgi:DNA-binding PadR family transcriptional regulator
MTTPRVESQEYAKHLRRSIINGTIELFILHCAQHEPVYGGALTRALRKVGHGVSPGTLYPLLHSLEQAKLLRSRSTTVRGRVRRYYELTPLGRVCYAEARQIFATLVREMFPNLEI